MTPTHRPRQLVTAGLAVVALLALGACSREYPNSTFNHHTEFNTAIDALWDKLLFLGTVVFILVEVMLIWTVIKFRRREGQPEPKHVHGNTTLEILWTVIPALILVFIAVPTVRTIFRTQAKAVPEALQVEVIGHQFWWEFRYPEYTTTGANGRVDTLTTANELYLPIGRTANFHLKTADVLHAFWVPQMGGKRDLIANHTNYLWFTPDTSLETSAWNGFCTEYCGASHANMQIRAYTVSPEEFDRWVQHQLAPPAVASLLPGQAPGAAGTGATGTGAGGAAGATAPPVPGVSGVQNPGVPPGGSPGIPGPGAPGVAPPTAPPATPAGPTTGAAPGAQAGAAPATLASAQAGAGWTFPREQLPDWFVPNTPLPRGLTFTDGLVGDPVRGAQTYSRSSCIGCHAIRGHPVSISNIGPNLTHFGSRNTLAAGMYPNDERHLRLWLKNARAMKPGAQMPTLGRGQVDPYTKQVVQTGALSDQEIADIVAYLMALK